MVPLKCDKIFIKIASLNFEEIFDDRSDYENVVKQENKNKVCVGNMFFYFLSFNIAFSHKMHTTGGQI